MAASAWAVSDRDRGGDGAAAADALDALVSARSDVGLVPFSRVGQDPMQAAHQCLFEAYAARCRDASTVELWGAAVESCDAAEMAWDATSARLRLAESLLASGGSRTAPAEALRRAHASAVLMGAVPLQEEVEALARTTRLSLAPVREVPRASADVLSKREREVLGHLVAGRSYAEIANALFISEKTVSAHVSNLLRKTSTSSRVEAAAWARRSGTAG